MFDPFDLIQIVEPFCYGWKATVLFVLTLISIAGGIYLFNLNDSWIYDAGGLAAVFAGFCFGVWGVKALIHD